MKSKSSKIFPALAACLCLAAGLVFVGQKGVAVSYAGGGGGGAETPLVETQNKVETRCGWFSNPTPANAWLNDREGEWLIGAQGGYQAEGDWAEFKPNQWVKTNGNYGHGCVCMKVTTDKKERRILTIKSATARPLSACRKDKKLKEPKDPG